MWPSYLDFTTVELRRRAEEAVASLRDCRVCPRDCGVDRTAGRPQPGERRRGRQPVCRTWRRAWVSSWFAHFGEEDCLRGWRGGRRRRRPSPRRARLTRPRRAMHTDTPRRAGANRSHALPRTLAALVAVATASVVTARPANAQAERATLELPSSSTETPLPGAQPHLVVATDRIDVSGVTVVDVVDGDTRASDRRTSDMPLLPVLQRAVEERLTQPPLRTPLEPIIDLDRPMLVLGVDRRTTYRVLGDVIMTTSAAGVQEFAFVVRAVEHGALWDGSDDGAAQRLAVLPMYTPTARDMGPSGVPRVLVTIRADGTLLVSDMLQSEAFAQSGLAVARPECVPPGLEGPVATLCPLAEHVDAPHPLEHVDFRGLYNLLAAIRRYPAWADLWDEQNTLVNVIADPDVPWEVVVRTLDVARWFLAEDAYADEASFRRAAPSDPRVPLLPRPVLLIPRARD